MPMLKFFRCTLKSIGKRGGGKLEIEVKERHQMNNKPIVYKNRKKFDRTKNKEINYEYSE